MSYDLFKNNRETLKHFIKKSKHKQQQIIHRENNNRIKGIKLCEKNIIPGKLFRKTVGILGFVYFSVLEMKYAMPFLLPQSFVMMIYNRDFHFIFYELCVFIIMYNIHT